MTRVIDYLSLIQNYISLIPNVILTWVTFFGAGLAAILIVVLRTKKFVSWKEMFHICIPFNPIKSKSFHADIKIKILRKILDPFLIVPELIFILYTAQIVSGAMNNFHGKMLEAHYNNNILASCVFIMVIATEFSYYIYHYIQHRVPFFWQLHKVHHSAEILNPLTDARAHILPMFVRTIIVGIIAGIPAGFMDYYFKIDLIKLSLLTGVSINVLRYGTLYPLKHSHFPLGFGPLDWVLVSAHMHQVHHSNAIHHQDTNFGVNLSIFDWLFGTAYRPAKDEVLTFGLCDEDSSEKYDTLWELYVEPVKRSVLTLRRSVKSEQLAG